MAKMKWGKDDVDWKGLHDEEYEENGFEPYDGPEPSVGTILAGVVDKAWLTKSNAGDWMMKVVFNADGNIDDKKVYDGWACWSNINFTLPQVKFIWQPFFDALGITLRDVKDRMIIGEEDKVGTAIDKIGKVEFPADVRIVVGKQTKGEYKGKLEIAKFLRPAEIDDIEDEDVDGDPPF